MQLQEIYNQLPSRVTSEDVSEIFNLAENSANLLIKILLPDGTIDCIEKIDSNTYQKISWDSMYWRLK